MPSIKKLLLPYQRKGIKKIDKFKGRALLADEMGLGKTIQALAWIKTRKQFPAVIVCPAFIKGVWQDECAHKANIVADVLEGRTPRKASMLQSNAKVIIVNYDILPHWLNYLKKLNPAVVVLDECHYIKSRGTKKRPVKRTRAAKSLCKSTRNVLALTGTPITNRLKDIFNTLQILNKDEFGSWPTFARRHCQPRKKPWGWTYDGAAHVQELHQKLKRTCMIRRRKKQVLKDLPEKSRHVIPLPIKGKKEYESAERNFIQWLGKTSPHKVKKAKRAQGLVQAGALLRLAADLKMESVFEWIDNFLYNEEKLIIFGVHKKTIDKIQKRYKDKSVRVTGNTSKKLRKKAVYEFQNDPKKRLFIGNVEAAGTGVTLTAASTVAFVEFHFSPGVMLQAEDRPHRIGQKKHVDIYYLVAQGTIEKKLCKILQQKQKVLSSAIDGEQVAEDQDSLNLFDQLIHTMELKA